MNNYSLLITKLDAFIRKFYINQLLRGALYCVGLVLTLFILMNLLEYKFYFSTNIRKSMFWTFLLTSGIALWTWVFVPLLHYFRLGTVISHEKAASIIGEHFTNVKDKLLNILQLKQQSQNALQADLINASINQKSEEIKLVPFTGAIDLGKNRKYLRFALPPLLLLLFLFFGAPSILREGTKRLFNNSTKYEKPAPFHFLVNSDSLTAVQFSDFPLKIKVEGAALPNEIFIDLGGAQYRLVKESANTFSYVFTNVQRDTEFKLFGGGVESDKLKLEVLEKPNIASFSVKLDFPKYIGRANEELQNIGDLVVPQGTELGWVFTAMHTEDLKMRFAADNQRVSAKRFDDELFQFNRRAMRDEPYKIFISNKYLPNGDSVGYSITVIPDLVPEIEVKKFADSTRTDLLFFAGSASDDYGLSSVDFHYQIKKAGGGQLPLGTVPMTKPTGKTTDYNYTFDLKNLELAPGDEVSYYFETFDNDGVNGAKSARTGVEIFKMPTIGEMKKETAENDKEIEKDLEKALKESLKIQEEMKKLREKVLQQKELDWQSRKEMEKLLDRQKNLDKQMEQAKQNFEKNMKMQQQMDQQSEQILEKQEQLQKMFEEVMSPEMKEMMKQIEEMLQNMNKEETLDKMEDMKMDNEQVTKELDRLQELFKQLEVEQKMEEAISELEKLAEEQEKLSQESEKEEKSAEELKKEQEKLDEKMKEIGEKLDDAKKKNEELERPKELPDTKEEQEDIKKDQKESGDDLKSKDKKGAAKKQKKAANKMKEMANSMKQKMDGESGDQAEEDMAALRQLLENIIGLSFNQEDNMNAIAKSPLNTPKYVELVQEQYKIKDDFKIVEDSLDALAKRVYQIEGFVLEKVGDIKSSIKKSTDDLEERQVQQANGFQQSSMKGLNDLALMLSETLSQMQAQANSDQPGSGSCKKPGKSKGKGKGKEPAPGDKMSKGQGGLNEMMKGLKERLDKQGKAGGQGGASSKEYAKMARQQAELRKALDEKRKEKQGEGKGTQALDEISKQMEETEKELVNKKLTNEMLKRQQDIMSKLLEDERAERQQEQDEKRQAETAQNIPPKMPPALEAYLKIRRSEVDQYRTVSPALRPYYKALVEEYLKNR
jgi:hypothetical protein